MSKISIFIFLIAVICVDLSCTIAPLNTGNGSISGTSADANAIEKRYLPEQERCGGGSSVRPAGYKSEPSKTLAGAGKQTRQLKYDIPFYGFTYQATGEKDKKDGKPLCPDLASLQPTDFEFIDNQANKILTAYISSKMSNDVLVAAALERVKPIDNHPGVKLADPYKLTLCVDLDCDGTLSPSSYQEFEYVGGPGVRFADNYSDSMLMSSTVDRLRNIYQTEDSKKRLDDNSIWGMVGAARTSALKNDDRQPESQ